MDINITPLSIFSLGGIHLHFARRSEARHEPVDLSFSHRVAFSSDSSAIRPQELPEEHDGSPLFVRETSMYLIGGAIAEEILDLSSLGFGRVLLHIKIYHRNGQVYVDLRSSDERFRGRERITSQVASYLASRLSGKESGSSTIDVAIGPSDNR